ncbi:MAG: hypothetical protein DMG76_24105 [Acidobacteria bacterium]|nr:MAG: hypothetical protein DMG76_24105 [Acidobacteriota bacterium]
MSGSSAFGQMNCITKQFAAAFLPADQGSAKQRAAVPAAQLRSLSVQSLPSITARDNSAFARRLTLPPSVAMIEMRGGAVW